MKLYKRGAVWWAQVGGRRHSTRCKDRVAAELWAASYERARIIIQAMKGDATLREQVREYIDSCREASSKGFVYGIQAGSRVKIGFTTKHPNKRMAELKVAASEPLHLVAVMRGERSDETRLHKQFKAAKIRREWFDATDPNVAAWVDTHRYEPTTYLRLPRRHALQPKAA